MKSETKQIIKMTLFALVLGAYGAVQAQSVPAGTYIRGDSNDGNGYKDEPTNQVYISAFEADQNLVTLQLWQQVYTWAQSHGYKFDDAGSAAANNYPVQNVNWYDAVKWCNARSEMDSLQPCYYVDAGTTVYRGQGDVALAASNVLWSATGYRLPTEAEWEKAARGGHTGWRFPLGNTVSHAQAWYSSPASAPPFDAGPYSVFETGATAVGFFPTNSYGLHDMAGNLREWCWDWYQSNYYTNSPTTDPRGPATGTSRVTRGGNWFDEASDLRCASRLYSLPASELTTVGFRSIQTASVTPPVQATQNVFFGSPAPTNVLAPTNLTLTAFTDTGETNSGITFAISNASPANLASITTGGYLTVTGAGTFDVVATAATWSSNGTNYSAASAFLPITAGLFSDHGYVDPTQLTNLLGTGKILLAELQQVLADYSSGTNLVNDTVLASFLGGSTNIVDQAGLNMVLAHYWLQSPPYISSVTFPGATNFSFTITNFVFTVQSSTNLTTWGNLASPATIVFTDTNAVNSPATFYRLVGSTNY